MSEKNVHGPVAGSLLVNFLYIHKYSCPFDSLLQVMSYQMAFKQFSPFKCIRDQNLTLP